MKRTYSGLEASVTGDTDYLPLATHEAREHGASPYRSRSEQIIADILENDDIRFGYEDALHVPREYAGSKSDRTWHPDFHLRDLGVIVEYAGMPDDEEYMKGVERKKEVYDQMGATVIWLYPEDLWERTADQKYGKLRDDAVEHILSKIGKVSGGSGGYFAASPSRKQSTFQAVVA